MTIEKTDFSVRTENFFQSPLNPFPCVLLFALRDTESVYWATFFNVVFFSLSLPLCTLCMFQQWATRTDRLPFFFLFLGNKLSNLICSSISDKLQLHYSLPTNEELALPLPLFLFSASLCLLPEPQQQQ